MPTPISSSESAPLGLDWPSTYLISAFIHLQPWQYRCIIGHEEAIKMLFRRKRKVIIEVSSQELTLIRESLLTLRDQLIKSGRHTDPVDEMLIKLF